MNRRNKIIEKDLEEIITEKINWFSLSGKTILVSGANGFIPSYIVETLLYLNEKSVLNKNVLVIAIVRNLEKAKQRFGYLIGRKDFKLIVSDISEKIDIEEHIDIIIHAASQASPKYYHLDPVGTIKANTLGTANLLDIAIKNKAEKFIFVSSSEVYGVINTPQKIDEKYIGNVDITDVRSCYAESKRVGEAMCVSWSYQYGLHVNMIRLAHVYGPGVSLTDGRVFADFVSNVINGENIKIYSDGSAKRCFIYITDMVRAFFYVLFFGENSQAYNISSEKETSILELANILVNMCESKKITIEFSMSDLSKNIMKSKSTNIYLSTEKIKALGWKEKVDIKTGFSRMIKSYQEN